MALRATCRAVARIWLAVIDFQNGKQQSRSGCDKKRRNRLQLIHKDPIGLIDGAKRQVLDILQRETLNKQFIYSHETPLGPVVAPLFSFFYYFCISGFCHTLLVIMPLFLYIQATLS